MLTNEQIGETIVTLGVEPFTYGEPLSKEFVYSMALKDMNLVENYEIETAAVEYDLKTKKVTLHYNPGFIRYMAQKHNWNETQAKTFLRAVVKHEILHFILKHLVPDKNRPNPKIRNLVTDALINESIVEFKALKSDLVAATPEKLVKGEVGEFDLLVASEEAKRNDWGWEEYYDYIVQLMKAGANGESISRMVPIKDGSINGNDIRECDELDPVVEKKIEELMETAKNAGSVPGALLEEVNAKLKRTKLERFIRSIARAVYHGRKIEIIDTYKKPNRRFDTFPGTRRRYVSSKIVVLVDVSGSITWDLLRQFMSEVYSLAKAYDYSVELYTYDVGLRDRFTEVQVRRGIFTVEGRGGTNLKQALEDLSKTLKGPVHTIVVFTDGYDEPPCKDMFPAKNVIFVFSQSHSKDFREAVAKYSRTYSLADIE